ncbi:MAG TPA: hypothetical protein PLU50_04960, partial [Pseudobdellovibrionaceae bacterium]|nr:hypothetical protein [Pseudobdellovibrionaceae bacterium]
GGRQVLSVGVLFAAGALAFAASASGPVSFFLGCALLGVASALTLYEVGFYQFSGSKNDLARQFQIFQAMHANYFGRSKSVTDLAKVIYFRILVRSPQVTFSEIYEFIQEDHRLARYSTDFALLPETRARMIESLVLGGRSKSSVQDARSVVMYQSYSGVETMRESEMQSLHLFLPLRRVDEVLNFLNCSPITENKCFDRYLVQNKFFDKQMYSAWSLDELVDSVSYQNIRSKKPARAY